MGKWISANDWAKAHSDAVEREFIRRRGYLIFLAHLMEQEFAHGAEDDID